LTRKVAANALVSLWGNRYSTPPGFVGVEVTVTWRAGTDTINIVSPSGAMVVTHRLAPRGSQRTVRLPQHTAALENVVLAEFSTAKRCPTKPNRPPSDVARAIAADIAGGRSDNVVIDLAVYQAHIDAGSQNP